MKKSTFLGSAVSVLLLFSVISYSRTYIQQQNPKPNQQVAQAPGQASTVTATTRDAILIAHLIHSFSASCDCHVTIPRSSAFPNGSKAVEEFGRGCFEESFAEQDRMHVGVLGEQCGSRQCQQVVAVCMSEQLFQLRKAELVCLAQCVLVPQKPGGLLEFVVRQSQSATNLFDIRHAKQQHREGQFKRRLLQESQRRKSAVEGSRIWDDGHRLSAFGFRPDF